MAKIQEGELLERAQQGNTQAIMVLLNRYLLSKGAHIKVKQKKDCLQILLQAPRMTEKNTLLQFIREQLVALRPLSFKHVKIYCPRPGTESASLIYEFALSGLALPPPPQPQPQRYSIADFLSDATSIDDLLTVRQHPFFTGRCPQCGHSFDQSDSPPIYWDCEQCGWVDNLDPMAAKTSTHSSPKNLGAIKRLGNYLMEAGLLTPDQLAVALADQRTTGMRLGDILARRGWVKEATIEYLMKKVVLPERSHSQHQSALSLGIKPQAGQGINRSTSGGDCTSAK